MFYICDYTYSTILVVCRAVLRVGTRLEIKSKEDERAKKPCLLPFCPTYCNINNCNRSEDGLRRRSHYLKHQYGDIHSHIHYIIYFLYFT